MKAKRERDYWERTSGIDNIRSSPDDSQIDIERELAFLETPERAFACRGIGAFSGKRILEIGAGIGINAFDMAQRGAEMVIIDFALFRLEQAEALAAAAGLKITAIAMDAHALGFPDESFDAIYTKSVMIHLDIDRVIPEIKRVLKPGGKAVFIEPLKRNPFVNFYRRFFAPKEWASITEYFDDSIIAKITAAFGASRERRFYLFSFAAFFWRYQLRNLALFKISLRILNRIDTILFTLIPRLKRFAWFSVLIVEK